MNPGSVLLVALLAGVYITASTQPAALAGWVGDTSPEKPANVPTWGQYADDFPKCSTEKRLGDVVFVGQDARAHRVSFDRAWRVAHDSTPANDGWVVGWCR